MKTNTVRSFFTSLALAAALTSASAGTFSIVGASLSFTPTDSTQFATGASSTNNYTLNYGINYYMDVMAWMRSLVLFQSRVTTPLGSTFGSATSGGGEEAVAPVQKWIVQWVPGPGETTPPSDWSVDCEVKGIAFASVTTQSPVAGTFSGSDTVSTIDAVGASAIVSGAGSSPTTKTGGSSTAVRFSDLGITGGGWTEVSTNVWQSTVQLTANGSVQCLWVDSPSAVSSIVPSTVNLSPSLNINVRPISINGQSVEPTF